MKGERAGPNEMRDSLLELINERPGITPSELLRITGFNEGTVRYHLDLLEREGKVRYARAGMRKAYFPADGQGRIDGVGRSGGSSNNERILGLIRSRPNIAKRDLRKMVNVTGPGLTHILKALEGKGLIAANKENGEVRYSAVGEKRILDEMLLELIERYLDGHLSEDRFMRLKEEIQRRKTGLN